LVALSESEQQLVRNIWQQMDSASPALREIIIGGILHKSCLPQLSYISAAIKPLTKVDFIAALPTEISFRVLRYLDGQSLCHCAQVSRRWRIVSDDDAIWHRMCTQHIDRKCTKCGWGLPLIPSVTTNRSTLASETPLMNAPLDVQTSVTPSIESAFHSVNQSAQSQHRPWKHAFAERLIVEQNWRRTNYTSRTLQGHRGGVLALWYDDCTSRLVTGGYDSTLRAWNVETGECLAIMTGHTRCVRGVQFDNSKIISCSMDRTLRIWSTETFECLRVVVGHNDGVVCLHFTETILASGSADGVIRVTKLAANKTSNLSGHTDWVNKVMILPCRQRLLSCSDDMTIRLWNIESGDTLLVYAGHVAPVQCFQLIFPRYSKEIKLEDIRVVTGSLDHTIKIWNFATGQTLRTLFGHIEGVWCVDVNSLRVVSGSHDHTLKVWDIESEKCMYTIEGHLGSVNCCWLTDTKLISGDEN
ncbi:hypothetical protein BATDEDRAFT_1302, partial [Batrachochytrium dendrobatidis JAM81]